VAEDSLRLIFTCCHPTLSIDAQVALTLRTLCGLTTEEIARAFLLPVPTLQQRLVRAKGKIKGAKIPYVVPDADALPERLVAVMHVIYLVFNEGYSASFGPSVVRAALSAEALRLGRLLVELLPGEGEPLGLLALMLLHDSRRASRVDREGALVVLEEQDRSLWDLAQIAEGLSLVESALSRRPPGAYAVQAAIAALHARAPRADDTDWPQIAALYGVLSRISPTPIVGLNRAVAIAMADGLERGLAIVEQIDRSGVLDRYHLLPAARAELLRRLGRHDEAAVHYRRALELVTNDAERRYLERRVRSTAS
jgi:RNA polymerase sigma-70 factor (ECF subfamily)